MKNLVKICLIVLLVSVLGACVTNTVKAPCNQYGTFCGVKTKINQW